MNTNLIINNSTSTAMEQIGIQTEEKLPLMYYMITFMLYATLFVWFIFGFHVASAVILNTFLILMIHLGSVMLNSQRIISAKAHKLLNMVIVLPALLGIFLQSIS